jgi:hypothetical protein
MLKIPEDRTLALLGSAAALLDVAARYPAAGYDQD